MTYSIEPTCSPVPHTWLQKSQGAESLSKMPSAAQVPRRPAHTDPLLEGLLRLTRQVAARQPIAERRFDDKRIASELRARIDGLELNICSPSKELKDCLAAFEHEDVDALHSAALAGGGGGISYVELDAELLPLIKPALMHGFPGLECITFHVNEGEALPDLSGLQSADGVPRLHVIASRPSRLPCAADAALRDSLASLLEAAQPSCEAFAIARAIMDCAQVDASGEFGWDFTRLPTRFVQGFRALPVEAFRALQDSAEKTGTGTAWVRLPDEFDITPDCVAKLRELQPLFSLSVASPSKSNFIGLGGLRGLEKLDIRDACGSLWVVVPNSVKDLNADETGPEGCLVQLKVAYRDAHGKTVEQETHITSDIEATLHLRLTSWLGALNPMPTAEPWAAAQAIIDCAGFDDAGRFGWDFRALASDHAACLRALPARAFMALQRFALAATGGVGAEWFCLPNGLVHEDLSGKLAQLRAPVLLPPTKV